MKFVTTGLKQKIRIEVDESKYATGRVPSIECEDEK